MAKERSPVYCKTLDKNKLKNKKKIKEKRPNSWYMLDYQLLQNQIAGLEACKH